MLMAILITALAAGDPPLKLDVGEVSRAPSFRVLKVPDGNSIVLKTGVKTARIRLLGVQAPDGMAARAYDYLGSRFLEELLRDQSVHLRFESVSMDVETPHAAAYIYRASDGLLVNLEMIRQGYGKTPTGTVFKLREAFLVEERKAREERCGLWSPDATAEYDLVATDRTKAFEKEIGVVARKRWERRIRPLLIDNPRLRCPICLNEIGVNCGFCGGIRRRTAIAEERARESRRRAEEKERKSMDNDK
jgi:endonuclease YncB( thermonuclease family)